MRSMLSMLKGLVVARLWFSETFEHVYLILLFHAQLQGNFAQRRSFHLVLFEGLLDCTAWCDRS